ncbi:TNF receptor-associated factor 4-like [Halichondria panicea]|uniref:TNF receptor-associated factor 4-like n=1 Tax=Halichondria panicea TaxID=6063 RepID=UPI00312B5289
MAFQERIVGFDCEFLEPPSENLQTDCPVCLQIIREPHQVTCCGKKYCKACIQAVKVKNKPCPTCNTEGFSNFPDTGHKQLLYNSKVRCSHQKDGCEWTGELRQLDEHLNTDPQPEKQLDGCLLTTINCDFHHVGCAVKLPRQDMPEHVSTNIHRHMSLMVTGHMTLASAHSILENDHANLEKDHKKLAASHILLTKSYAKLVEEHVLLNGSHKRLKQEHESLSSNSVQTLCKYEELKDNCAKIKTDNQQLRTKIEALEGSTRPPPPRPPLADPPRTETIHIVPSDALFMEKFEQHKRGKIWWYSPPVYTHPQGYKICLGVVANGHEESRGTHVSVFVFFMKGEYDDFLPWPFRGSILIQLVDQNGQAKNTYTCMYDDTVALKYCNRVIYREQAMEGWGSKKFLAHNMLKKPLFIRDRLIFIISGETRV